MNERLDQKGNRRFLGVIVRGNAGHIEGQEVNLKDVNPEQLQNILRNQAPGKSGRLVINMKDGSPATRQVINQMRDVPTDGQRILYFEDKEAYRNAARDLTDWIHQADIDIDDR